MIVCQCNGVSDRTVRRAVREGAGSVAELSRRCGAGACCGGCRDSLREILHSEASSRDENAGTTASSQPASLST